MITSSPLVLTVSQLNRQVKSYLEHELGIVYVTGELSNVSKPSSGHYYFSLKDSNAQIRCVLFKNKQLRTTQGLSDGQQVTASGKLSLYEARGDYQLIIDELKDAGLGPLYQRFEELKNKLAAEGLFQVERKKPLPSLPNRIGVITSPTGAAIKDILSTLARRYPLAEVVVYPCEVQGSTAAQQLIKALQQAQTLKPCEVLILARGGGSIEDLWAFNDEDLARAIAACSIPVVTGIGHETDYTIADFVADYRAETPTAAAAAVTPNRVDLLNQVQALMHRLSTAMHRQMQSRQIQLQYLKDRLSSPKEIITRQHQQLDHLETQLLFHLKQAISHKHYSLEKAIARLESQNPYRLIREKKLLLQQMNNSLVQQMQTYLNKLNTQFKSHLTTLQAVSPLATLDRGYAIASINGKVLTEAAAVISGDKIEVRLAKGTLICDVIGQLEQINWQIIDQLV